MSEKISSQEFTPVRMGRAAEDVSLQIEGAILRGDYRPGERLPSERELQQRFKTGRGVIREALKSLKQKDLLEIRLGSRGGAFIKQVDTTNVSENLSIFLAQNMIDTSHIIEFRESIDRTITTLAIARGTKEEKQQLVDMATELALTAADDNPDMARISDIDRALNLLLAHMAHNPVYAWLMKAMQHGFSSYDFSLYEKKEYRRKTVINWQETAGEIQKNEPLKALNCIGFHYSLLFQCIREQKAATDIENTTNHQEE